MAVDVDYGNRSMASCFAAQVQEELGILAFSNKQRALDHLGSARWSLCFDCLADLSCFFEYQGSSKKPVAGKLTPLYQDQKLDYSTLWSQLPWRNKRLSKRSAPVALEWRRLTTLELSPALRSRTHFINHLGSRRWKVGGITCQTTLSLSSRPGS